MPMGYRLREVTVPILPKGKEEIRILHFSDLHLTPYRRQEIRDIKSWASLKPDFVISTGDFLAHKDAVNTVIHSLGDLLNVPGLYVFGSNDYYAPRMKNPFSYLKRDDGRRKLGTELPFKELDSRLSAHGWKNLNTSKLLIDIKGVKIEARGTDDAHLERDSYFAIKGSPEEKCFSILVTHAPYLRLLNSAIKDEIQLVLSGHTHGGQIRLPWFPESKALTTNCDLPTSMSRGLTKLSEKTWLHVSAGLGSSPFTPIRFACPGEVTRITLVSESNDS